MTTLAKIPQLMKNAIDYLILIQNEDGSWHDYRLPVGESDQWVTAFTALGITQASRRLDYSKGIEAAYRSVEFLQKNQGYRFGWGFNRHVGVDADSTAHVIRLFRELKIDVRSEDEDCLILHYDGQGAFRTYRVDSEWGKPHPDVTAAAGLALNDFSLKYIREHLLRYCRAIRLTDGSWPTYWWRNHQYGTYYMLELYERLGEPVSLELSKIIVTIQSCFDLAWSLGILLILGKKTPFFEWAVQTLFDMQEDLGAWPGSPSLRVTEPNCVEPWNSPSGEYYTDINSTITTSSVLRVLSRCPQLIPQAAP